MTKVKILCTAICSRQMSISVVSTMFVSCRWFCFLLLWLFVTRLLLEGTRRPLLNLIVCNFYVPPVQAACRSLHGVWSDWRPASLEPLCNDGANSADWLHCSLPHIRCESEHNLCHNIILALCNEKICFIFRFGTVLT